METKRFPNFQLRDCQNQRTLQLRSLIAINLLTLPDDYVFKTKKQLPYHQDTEDSNDDSDSFEDFEEEECNPTLRIKQSLKRCKILQKINSENSEFVFRNQEWLLLRYRRYIRSIFPLLDQDREFQKLFPSLQQFQLNVNNLNDWSIIRKKAFLRHLSIKTAKISTYIQSEEEYREAKFSNIINFSRRFSKNLMIQSTLRKIQLEGAYDEKLKLLMKTLKNVRRLSDQQVQITLNITKDGDFDGVEEDPEIIQFFNSITTISILASEKIKFFVFLVQNAKLFPNLKKFIFEIYGKIENDNPWPVKYISNIESLKEFYSYNHNLNQKTMENFYPCIRIPQGLEVYHFVEGSSKDIDFEFDESEFMEYINQFDNVPNLKAFNVECVCSEKDLAVVAISFSPLLMKMNNLEQHHFTIHKFEVEKEKLESFYIEKEMVYDITQTFFACKEALNSMKSIKITVPLMSVNSTIFMDLIPERSQMEVLELGNFWFGVKNMKELINFADEMGKRRVDQKPVRLVLNQIYINNIEQLEQQLKQIYQPRHVVGSFYFDLTDLDPKLVFQRGLSGFMKNWKGKPLEIKLRIQIRETNEFNLLIGRLAQESGNFKCVKNFEIEVGNRLFTFYCGRYIMGNE